MNRLSLKGEIKLVKYGSAEKIMSYIEHYRLCHRAEMLLFSSAPLSVLQAYVSAHSLFYINQCRLLKMDDETFGLYIQNHRLSDEVEAELIQKDKRRKITSYVKRWYYLLGEPAKEELQKSEWGIKLLAKFA